MLELHPFLTSLTTIYIPCLSIIMFISIFIGYLLGYKLHELLALVKLNHLSNAVDSDGFPAALFLVLFPIFMLLVPVLNIMVLSAITLILFLYLFITGVKNIHNRNRDKRSKE